MVAKKTKKTRVKKTEAKKPVNEKKNVDKTEETGESESTGIAAPKLKEKFDLSALNDALKKNNIMTMSGREPGAKIRKRLHEAKHKVDAGRWAMAAAIYEIYESGVFGHWGYNDWDHFVATELETMSPRTVQYLKTVYRYFSVGIVAEFVSHPDDDPNKVKAMQKRDEIIDAAQDLGWGKCKALVGVLNLENSERWLDTAKTSTLDDLKAEVKRALKEKKGIDDEDVEVKKNATFRVGESELVTIEDAIEVGTKMMERDEETVNRGEVITMICQEFLANNMGQEDVGEYKFKKTFNRLGSMFGARVILVDRDNGRIIHGKDLYEELKEIDDSQPDDDEEELLDNETYSEENSE